MELNVKCSSQRRGLALFPTGCQAAISYHYAYYVPVPDPAPEVALSPQFGPSTINAIATAHGFFSPAQPSPAFSLAVLSHFR
jgi:hypothetical protein